MEDKREICKKLYELLRLTRAGDDLVSINYVKEDQEEFADVCRMQRRPDGASMSVQRVCVTADSGAALIRDVMRII